MRLSGWSRFLVCMRIVPYGCPLFERALHGWADRRICGGGWAKLGGRSSLKAAIADEMRVRRPLWPLAMEAWHAAGVARVSSRQSRHKVDSDDSAPDGPNSAGSVWQPSGVWVPRRAVEL